MDTSPPITHIGLCAGYGGIELGLHRVIRNLRSVAFCEIEGFACANLVAKMEAGLLDCAPIWTNLKTFPWAEFRDRVDILTGGYPCQPFSAAGKRLGTEDPRHLWPFIADGIRVLRPKLCFFENVEGHISLGLREVLGDLGAAGYTAAWGIFSASEVGAPHQRKRVFILAEPDDGGWLQCATGRSGGLVWPSRPGEQQFAWEPPRVVANSHRLDWSAQAEGREHDRQAGSTGEATGNADHGRLASGINAGSGAEADRGGQGDIEQAESGQIERSMGLHSHGTSDGLGHSELSILSHQELAEIREWMVKCDNRTDELRLLGNGVVPATAERAFLTLWEELFQQQPTN